MKANKWIIETEDHYICGDQRVIRTHCIAIPPTDGDRIDIIDTDGNYHFGVSINEFKDKFMDRISKDEYLERILPGLDGKEKENALKNIDWTPKRTQVGISIIIEIKKGEVFLKGKL